MARPCNLGCFLLYKTKALDSYKIRWFSDPQPVYNFVVTVGQGFFTTGKKRGINLLEKVSALTDWFQCTEWWRLIFLPTSVLDPKSWLNSFLIVCNFQQSRLFWKVLSLLSLEEFNYSKLTQNSWLNLIRWRHPPKRRLTR